MRGFPSRTASSWERREHLLGFWGLHSGPWTATMRSGSLPASQSTGYNAVQPPELRQSLHTPKLHYSPLITYNGPLIGLHDRSARRSLAPSETHTEAAGSQVRRRLAQSKPVRGTPASPPTGKFPRARSLLFQRRLAAAEPRDPPPTPAPGFGGPPPASAPAARNSGTVVPARVGNLNALARH